MLLFILPPAAPAFVPPGVVGVPCPTDCGVAVCGVTAAPETGGVPATAAVTTGWEEKQVAVNPLSNHIRYNTKICYNVNLVCTKISGSCIFFY